MYSYGKSPFIVSFPMGSGDFPLFMVQCPCCWGVGGEPRILPDRPWRHMISMISWKELRIWTLHSGMTTHSVYIYIYIRVPWYKRALLHRTSPTNHHENTCDPENIKGSSTSCKTLAQGSDGIPQVTEVFRSEPDRQWISWSWNIHWFNGWLFHVFFPSNYVAVRVKFANSGRRTNWTSEFL